MNTLKLIIILMSYECFALETNETAYCFQFTWPGSMPYNSSFKYNCTEGTHINVPCVNPIIIQWDYPNTTEMYLKWLDGQVSNDQDSYMCPLQKGLACIKYTNIYNGAVLFASHYCGRVLVDKKDAISSGCFNYGLNGHEIEACACQSEPGQEPCNTATKQILSILMLLPGIIILFYYFHKV